MYIGLIFMGGAAGPSADVEQANVCKGLAEPRSTSLSGRFPFSSFQSPG